MICQLHKLEPKTVSNKMGDAAAETAEAGRKEEKIKHQSVADKTKRIKGLNLNNQLDEDAHRGAGATAQTKMCHL